MVDDKQIQRADGSKATAYALPLAASRELDGLDILTWPSYSPIWPDPDQTARTHLFSIQGGLVKFEVNSRLASHPEEWPDHVFSLENGDNWFYFEDQYTGSSLARSAYAKPSPFAISTISGSETEVLRLKFINRPKHEVLHKGACHFTGVKTPAESSSFRARTSSVNSSPDVQVRIEEFV
ncbi:hypothetical protein LTR66_003754 [Elasticomyces elasticus]|nr:hypothetical protein LTR66_003754 [Elasticomyces elasticus]